MAKEIITYKGRPITELTREELLEALTDLFHTKQREQAYNRKALDLMSDLRKAARF